MTEDKLREEVVQLLQDKEKYQNTAKEALRKAMQEKLEVSKKFKDTERYVCKTVSNKLICVNCDLALLFMFIFCVY